MRLWGTNPRPRQAFRFRPEGPSWDLPFLRRLAEGLAAYPAGHALLVECWTDEDPVIVPAAPELEAAIERAAWGVPGRLERIDPIPPAPRIPPGRGRFGVLEPPATVGPASPPEPRIRDPRGSGVGEGIEPWLPNEAELAGPDRRAVGAAQWHWFATGRPDLAVRVRLGVGDPTGPSGPRLAAFASVVASRLPPESGPTRFVPLSASGARRRAWATGALGTFWSGRPFRLTPRQSAIAVRPPRPLVPFDDRTLERHVAVLGASGSGKSTFLAHLARDRIARGGATVVLDVHGDLGPAIAAGLEARVGARVTAVDVTRPTEEVAGLPLFSSEDPDLRRRESAHLIAGLRHLSHDGSEVYWGPRLEQVFDVFVRLVEEERGGFADLYELLTDPARRDAARATTRSRVSARFLDELPGLLRRNPDYLQPAVARVQKVALHPKLRRLLDATERPIDLLPLLDGGGSIVFRIPSAELGPSECRFAATLLASRAYLAVAADPKRIDGLRVLAVFDEAHAISPSLLAEILSEGRKFGFGAAVATQYSGRLAPEALAAAEGAAGTHLVFHVPRAAAAAAGRWVGLGPVEAERLLPALPPGVALVDVALSAAPRGLLRIPRPDSDRGVGWETMARATSLSHGDGPAGGPEDAGNGSLEEALLLATFGLGSIGRPAGVPEVLEIAERIGPGHDRVELACQLSQLERRGWIEGGPGRLGLTTAGARRLGIGVPSGATRESDEHRMLLIEALRLFARHGEWLQIVRQGRFDTRLPDGLVRQLPEAPSARTPDALLRSVQGRSTRWLWRAFGGRDVHVEAEVSGAERPERIRRGLAKARAAGASTLFLVSTPQRARRVRAVLRAEGVRPPEAHVWTLSNARSVLRNRLAPESP